MLETATNEKKNIKRKRIKINKKKMARALFILSITTYLIHISFVYFIVNKYEKLIYTGVKVENIKLAGKTKEEAVNLLKNKYEKEMLKKNIVIKIQDKTYTINYSKLNIDYNIEDTVKTAFQYGKDKDKDTYGKYKVIKQGREKEFNLKYKYDKKEIEQIMKEIEKKFDENVVEASISKTNSDEFKISEEKQGQALNREKLLKDIDEGISNKAIKDVVISGEINKVNPKIKKSELEKIDTKITSFSTKFASSSSSRANNVTVAAKSLNGILVMPNEIFSFNKIVGERTEKNGYKPATVIVGDKFESGLGGGVCQVSTTLHNAILRMNILPTERQHHSIQVGYVGLGMDATVDYGSIDYKFKNILSYPIYIESLINDKNLMFNIYSNPKCGERKYEIVNSVQNVNKGGKIVRMAKAYKITYEKDKQISKEEINTDYY